MASAPKVPPQPPRLAQRLLALVALSEQRSALLGDLAEEYAFRAGLYGQRAAQRWYWRQARRSAAPFLLERLRLTWPDRPTSSRKTRMAHWIRDFSYAARTMMRRPLFATTVVATLAIGVGANTALFGVFKAVFLEPIPLPESEELVVVMQTAGFGCCGPASGPDYLDWVERERTFDGMAVLQPRTVNLTGLEEAERLYATFVSASAFELLGVEPLMGRPLLPEDEQLDTPTVTVLSHEFWRRALGSRPDVIGTSVEVDGTPLTVVGVMPPDFDVPSPWAATRNHQLYLPFVTSRLQNNRGNHGFPVIARLSEGTSLETAQADMDRIMRELADEYPETNANRGALVSTVHDYLYGDVGKQLLLILGAAGLVLLIACGNVASLQLARATEREAELTVRSALGASRSALVRLLFSESMLLAVVGAVFGVIVAFIALQGLRAILPPQIPRIDTVQIDALALGFAIVASFGSALIFGMAPAWLASRTDLATGLKEGGYGTLAPHKERLRDYFIILQIALGLVLVNGGTLLVRNYTDLRSQDQGFEAEGVLTVALNASGPRYESSVARMQFYDLVVAEVLAVPGVVSAGIVSKLPLAGGTNGNVWIEGRPPRTTSDEGPLVEVSSVGGDYFEAMGIPLLRGRTITDDDSASANIGVVINQAMVDEAWPDEDPIGKRFSFNDNPPEWRTVVGVVGTVRQWGPEQPARAEAYAHYAQGWSSTAYVVARVQGDAAPIARQLRSAVLAVDPTQPPSSIQAMDDRLENAFARRRFSMTLISLFAIAALLLAAAGIYGTVAFFVARRSRDLGIRIALGADGRGIAGLVVGQGLRLAAWGLALGLFGVWATTSLVESLLYGMGALHVPTLIAGCVVLGGVTVLAAALPARRAVRLPPTLVLRPK